MKSFQVCVLLENDNHQKIGCLTLINKAFMVTRPFICTPYSSMNYGEMLHSFMHAYEIKNQICLQPYKIQTFSPLAGI